MLYGRQVRTNPQKLNTAEDVVLKCSLQHVSDLESCHGRLEEKIVMAKVKLREVEEKCSCKYNAIYILLLQPNVSICCAGGRLSTGNEAALL